MKRHALAAREPLLAGDAMGVLRMHLLRQHGFLARSPFQHAHLTNIACRMRGGEKQHAFTVQGKITGIAGVVAWVLPAQAQQFFGRLADRTHSFDQGLMLASCLPLIAVLPLWLFWENKSERSSSS